MNGIKQFFQVGVHLGRGFVKYIGKKIQVGKLFFHMF